MKLSQYQNIYNIKQSIADEIDGIALCVCELYNYTPIQVNNFSAKKFAKICKKFAKEFESCNKKKYFHKTNILTDATKLNLGQFITLNHFLKNEVISNLHTIAASISLLKLNHKQKSNYYLTNDCRFSLPYVLEFLKSFEKLMSSYKGLFEIEENENEDLELISKGRDLKQHPFILQYGWVYSAKKISEWVGCTINEAYKLPIIEALNTLALLKSKQDYEKEMNK